MRPESTTSTAATLKVVGNSGQISIGKAFAGKVLRLTTQEDGSLLLTPVAIVPESQLWMTQEPHVGAIARGLAYAAQNAARETDLDALARKVPLKQPAAAGKVAKRAKVRLDLNSPAFLDIFLALSQTELAQVVAALERLRRTDWADVYKSKGLHWEAVDHIQTPNGAKAHSVRLSQKFARLRIATASFADYLAASRP